jgi:hypothetical protein
MFSTQVASSVAVHTSIRKESHKSFAVSVNEQLTDQTVQGAKYIKHYKDEKGKHWILARAPLDCMLDVTEGVLLSYSMETDQEPQDLKRIMQDIETAIHRKAKSYYEGNGAVYGRHKPVALQSTTLTGPDGKEFLKLPSTFKMGRYQLAFQNSDKPSDKVPFDLLIGYSVGPNRFVPIGRLDHENAERLTDQSSSSLTIPIGPGSSALERHICLRLTAAKENSNMEQPASWQQYVHLTYIPLITKIDEPPHIKDNSPHTPTVENGKISIDGRIGDWASIPVYYQDQIGDARKNGTDLNYIKVAMDDTRAYVLLVGAVHNWDNDVTFEINFDYAPGSLADDNDEVTDIHTNIRRHETRFWDGPNEEVSDYNPGVRKRFRGGVFELSIPLRRYDHQWFNIVYANVWVSGDDNPSDANMFDYQQILQQ